MPFVRLAPDSRQTKYWPLIAALVLSSLALIGIVWATSTQGIAFGGAALSAALILAFAMGLLAMLSRRQRANDAIAKSAALFRTTFDQTSVGISRTALDGRFVQANQGLCKLLGYTEQELLARTVRDISYPDDMPASEKVVAALLDDRGRDLSLQVEKRYLRKDGSVVWVLAAISLVRDAARKPSYFVTIIQDIGANKEAQERLRATFNQSAVGIAYVSADGRYIETNEHLSELLGYSQDEFCSMTTEEVIHPEDFSKVLGNRRVLDASECDAVVGEMRYIRKDGTVAWVNRSVSVVRDPAGQAKYYISMIQDISERTRGEEALRASEARFRSLTQMSSDFYWETDVEHRFTPNNSLANPIVPRPQVGQRRWEMPCLSPDQAGWQAHRAVLEARRPFRDFEISRLGNDGAVRYISVSGDPIFDASGTFLGYRGVGTDITERKRSEDALRESEARFRSLTQMSSDFYWETDAEHRFTSRNSVSNPGVSSIWRSQVGQRRWELPCLSPDQAGWRAHRAVLDAHRPFRDFEISRLGADGAEHYLSVSGDPEFDASGTFIGYRGVGTDITERKTAEQQLGVAAVVFESQEGMIVTDAEKVILRVNRAFSDISGYSAEEAVGQTTSLLSSGRHDRAFYAGMWSDIQRTGFWQGEIWNRRKNGEIYPEWLTITAVKGSDGEVSHYVGTLRDITERKAAMTEIEHLAFYDSLTNLPNRRLLLDRLNQALASSTRSGRSGALLFIDLDNFKTLNDTLGHEVGDRLLLQVAQRLSNCIREGDTVARLGGDEFVVMLEELSESPTEAATQAELVGEKILGILNAPYKLANNEHHSTPSIGITLFVDHQDTVDVLMKRADLAMYQAKAAGRNTLRFFDPEMQAMLMARAALEVELHQGIQEGQFLLYYQPQVDGGGRPTGAEALLRWQHPERGLVAPAEFIPLAEDTGLILPLGRWVLEAACVQLVAWAARPETRFLTLAVNVSAHQFRHKDFVNQVLAVLDHSRADPLKLKLELTESLLLENVEDVIGKMNALKARGVSFSLDDFGTGYSSLFYLKRLPLDQLKIDKSFVQDVLTDPNDAAIARTIVALGQSLGLAVIAEGVETEAQREFLAGHGCHAYQGYLFSRPLPPDQFARFAKRV